MYKKCKSHQNPVSINTIAGNVWILEVSIISDVIFIFLKEKCL